MIGPRATCRLQLQPDFTLHDVIRVVPYLARIGVSHVYLSPVTQATPGSDHGYDVTDPTRVADALGGEDALRALADVVHAHDMGVLLDIVPNHMAASSENAWWADLLAQGASSEHVSTFDTPLLERRSTRLCLPVLGAPVEDVIAREELLVAQRDGRPILQYHDNWFPIPDSAADLVGRVRADPGALRQLLDALPYELADWHAVTETVCYRRFFDITALVGVRVEDPAVFERTHAGILLWLERGWIDGLRIDHIDGLRDPAAYLQLLGAATASARGGEHCYTVVEKILAPDESLPDGWQTDGTTGYEFARVTAAFLVDRAGYQRMDEVRRRTTREPRGFATFVHDRKRFVLDALFPAELADVSARVATLARTSPDATLTAVRELTASLDVYRTYISERGVSAEDRLGVLRARARALPHLHVDDHGVLDAVCEALLLESTFTSDDERARAIDAVARWQQLSAPAMAKGFEDTALYGWPALLAMNDVGGDPEGALDADAVHAFFASRARAMPGALNATSTHDTKRGEDVRARLLALAEHPDDWANLVDRWWPVIAADEPAIAPRDGLTLLQTLIGAWPLGAPPDQEFTERIQAYMQKAAREAKEQTSWRESDAPYEQALARCVVRVLSAPSTAPLRADLQRIVERIALHGAVNSLAQTLLKCTAPGIPDIYQGTERWQLDLVDPDNRRPVDFDALAHTASALAALVAAPASAGVRALLHSWRTGRIKQFVLMAALACRARTPALVVGDYTPVPARGPAAAHVLAFRRRAGSSHALTVVTRWPARLAGADTVPAGTAWAGTSIDVATDVTVWRCALTGERVHAVDGTIRLADALAELPFGLWTSEA